MNNLARKQTPFDVNDIGAGILVLGRHGVVEEANTSAFDLLGLGANDLFGQSLIEHLSPFEMPPPPKESFSRDCDLLLKGQLKPTLFRLNLTTGKRQPVLMSSRLSQNSSRSVIVVLNALPETPATHSDPEHELHNTNDNIVRWISDMLLVLDGEGKILRSNVKAQDVLGYSEEELLGMKFIDLQPPAGFFRYFKMTSTKDLIDLANLRELVEQDCRIVAKNGQTIDISLTASAIPGEPENHGIILLAKDSRDSIIIRNLRLRQQQLVQSAKLASLGELSGGIAHEINNPLSIINGFVELMAESIAENDTILKDYPKFPQHIRKIRDAGDKIASIVQHVKDFCRLSSGEFTNVKINQILKNSFVLLRQQLFNRGITLKITLCDGEPLVYGDPTKLEQVFVNIIGNARDALTEKYKRQGGNLSVTTTKIAGKIIISFVDDGTGIPEKTLHRIFDPFFTTKEIGQGSGLGLSTAHGIVLEHHGQIRCFNNSLGGTTAEVELEERLGA